MTKSRFRPICMRSFSRISTTAARPRERAARLLPDDRSPTPGRVFLCAPSGSTALLERKHAPRLMQQHLRSESKRMDDSTPRPLNESSCNDPSNQPRGRAAAAYGGPDSDHQGLRGQTRPRRFDSRRLEDPQQHAPRTAICLQGVRPVPASPQSNRLRFVPHVARRARVPTGARVRTRHGRARLDGHHRRGERNHGSRTPRGWPRPRHGPEYHVALRAAGEPGHCRGRQARAHEVLLHPQADVRQGIPRGGLPARRVRNVGRGAGSADAAADRKTGHGAGRPAGRSRRELLAGLAAVHREQLLRRR